MGIAIVVGVGAEAGLGAALCRRFAAEGLAVLVAGPTAEKVGTVAEAISLSGGRAIPIAMDATDEAGVVSLFDQAETLGGAPGLVVYNAGTGSGGGLRDISAAAFEATWRVSCLGGFLVGREAARRMVPAGRGTVVFTGATASLRGRAGVAAFAAAKAGLRMVAQSMAREFGPLGIHVAHVIIDGAIDGHRVRSRSPERASAAGEDGLLKIEAIADAYWHLHRQHRSAWTQEIDLRPYKENF